MKPEEQIKALAELDGWKPYSPGDFNPTLRWINDKHTVRTLDEFRWYLTSYDAIIPLIQKQPFDVRGNVEKHFMFLSDTPFVLDRTPTQLCEALLRATGKRKE